MCKIIYNIIITEILRKKGVLMGWIIAVAVAALAVITVALLLIRRCGFLSGNNAPLTDYGVDGSYLTAKGKVMVLDICLVLKVRHN